MSRSKEEAKPLLDTPDTRAAATLPNLQRLCGTEVRVVMGMAGLALVKING